MKKKFLKNTYKFSALALAGLLSACAQKYDSLPNTRIMTCPNPIATYEIGIVRSGEHNSLEISRKDLQSQIQEALTQSNCFLQTQQTSNLFKHYRLDIAYGNINTQNTQNNFLRSETSDTLIFEVQLAFNHFNEVRIFQGKSSIESTNKQYLKVFGKSSMLDANQIQITLQNAVNSAVNEAVRNFSNQ